MPEQTARRLADRYDLEEPIAKGGMAMVWRAVDTRLGRPVAVKVLHTRHIDDASLRERFRREAVAAASFNHPNIATVYDSGQDDGSPYIVMELVDGPSLSRLLGKEGRLSPPETVHVMRAVLSALAYSHAHGVVHRDIKPANVLLTNRPGSASVKVVDFGIARAMEGGDLTAAGAIIGTASYLAPEQAAGEAVDSRADIYALGCVAYRCLAGRVPFSADTDIGTALARTQRPPDPLRPQCPDAPRQLVAVVERALSRDPDDRYGSATETLDALEGLPATRVTLDRRSPAPRATPPRRDTSPPPAPSSPGRRTAPPPRPAHSGPRPSGRPADSSTSPRPPSATGRTSRQDGTVTHDPKPHPTSQPRPLSPTDARRHRNRLTGAQRRGITLAAVIAAVILGIVVLATRNGGDEPVAPPTLEPVGVVDFDPGGDTGRENPGQTERAIDGDVDTAWTTERYRTPLFSGIKDGVGLLFDLGEPVTPRDVRVVATPGTVLELRTADDLPADADEDDLGELTEVVAGPVALDASGIVMLETGDATARRWLLWVTELPPLDGGEMHRASILDVAFGRDAGTPTDQTPGG